MQRIGNRAFGRKKEPHRSPRKSQQMTMKVSSAFLMDIIAGGVAAVKRDKRANGALERARFRRISARKPLFSSVCCSNADFDRR
jgi:hypothetical protein